MPLPPVPPYDSPEGQRLVAEAQDAAEADLNYTNQDPDLRFKTEVAAKVDLADAEVKYFASTMPLECPTCKSKGFKPRVNGTRCTFCTGEYNSGLVPYPEFCRHPDRCGGLSSCPRDPCCCD